MHFQKGKMKREPTDEECSFAKENGAKELYKKIEKEAAVRVGSQLDPSLEFCDLFHL